jgi:ABC-type cobalamin/Fe3+-siderophores transport system ATPase subunit
MLILDESGNNLDGPNLTRVSRVLRQVSEKYGLTVVLACQDLYTDLVAEHSAGMIQLVRSSPKDALNTPPVIIQGEEDHRIAEMLMPYLRMGRPEALAPYPL